MIWRRLIRGICIALLALCVTAWVGSYWECPYIEWTSNSGDFHLAVVIDWGRTQGQMSNVDFSGEPGWKWAIERSSEPHKATDYFNRDYGVLGFGISHCQSDKLSFWNGKLPLWFPTLLSALLLCHVWRKTRRKHTAKGFPVEAEGNVSRQTPNNGAASAGVTP
jgi:hypothetical protein